MAAASTPKPKAHEVSTHGEEIHVRLHVASGQQLGVRVASGADGRPCVGLLAVGSVAENSGAIREGDTIVAIDDQRVGTDDEARRKLGSGSAPLTIKLTLLAAKEKPVKSLTAFWA
eukprot:4912061-Prymnesium_polylepis.1